MKTYIVARDSSVSASQVLAEAIALAQSTGAKLVLFRAIGLPSDLPIEAYAMSPDGVVLVLQQRATAELADLAKRIPAGVEFEVRQEIGAAWQAICEAGRQVGASLIVIGSPRSGGAGPLLCPPAPTGRTPAVRTPPVSPPRRA